MSDLVVDRLGKSFGGVRALHDVSFELSGGEMVAVIGPNGAGKSTCFNIIGGQITTDAGSVSFEGQRLDGRGPRAVAARGVGRMFQIAQVFGSMTVLENVQLALVGAGGRWWRPWPPLARIGREEAFDLLERVGIADQAERACGVLAYGDLKRVELAMALAGSPRLLLMDEPTSGMAPAERRAMMGLVGELARGAAIAVLFTEHDMDVVFGHADRIVVLSRGEVIATGVPAAIRADARVREAYLGQAAP